MEKKYKHLVKPLIVQRGPEELYDEPRFWMESKDLEGFNVHFSYGFIKKPCVCHSVKNEALVHPYDEVLVFAPYDPADDILDLGAEVSISLGEEGETHYFDESTLVVIPKGVPHGPVEVRRLNKPIVHYLVGLGPEYRAEAVARKPAARSMVLKYIRLIKKFRMARMVVSRKLGRTLEMTVRPPVTTLLPAGQPFAGPANADQIAWFYSENLEGLELNVSWGFYSRPGIGHRIGRGGMHKHPVEEMLIWVGLDPENINYLGCEMEVSFGEEEERHVFNKPAAVLVPKNVVHCPFICRWVDKPYGFIVLCLGGEHETTWFPPEE